MRSMCGKRLRLGLQIAKRGALDVKEIRAKFGLAPWRVHWTHTAIEHLLAIYEHIAQDAPLYAQRMIDRLTKRSEQITAFPRSGRMVPEY